MGHNGDITRGLRLISSGLRHSVARLASRSVAAGLRVGHLLLEQLERRGQPSNVTDEELLHELAKVLSDPDLAVLIVRQAGFPAHLVPTFRVPLTFWAAVLNAAKSGMIEGGVMAVVTAAADCFPGSDVLWRYRRGSDPTLSNERLGSRGGHR